MSVKEILAQSKLSQLKRKMELDPLFRDVKTVAEIVLEKTLLEKLEEFKLKIEELLAETQTEIESDLESVKEATAEQIASVELQKGEKGKPGKPGKNGKDYVLTETDKKEIAGKITVPVVKKVIEKTEVIKEKPIVTQEIKEVAKYEEAGKIALKLNTLEEKIDKKVIKGLDKELVNIKKAIREKAGGVKRGGGDIIYLEDLSTQTDGNTLIFTVPKHRKAIMVIGSDFPSVLFENNGFTVNSSRTQITLTVSNAPSQGSQLGFQYVV